MQHPPWWENTTSIIAQRRIEVCLEKVVNNTENKIQCLLLPDGLFTVRRSIQLFSDFSVICHNRNAWPKTWQSHYLLTARCDVLHHHRRIYLKSWPWLPTVTMPDHRVITTFTLVKFLLSFAAFTKVSVSVYTRKVFTWVSKLSYLSKPFTSKLGIYQHSTLEVSRCPSLQSSCVIPFEHLPSAFHCCSSS